MLFFFLTSILDEVGRKKINYRHFPKLVLARR